MSKKYPNEPDHKDLDAQRQWEYDNLTNEQLEERGWFILDCSIKPFAPGCFCRICKHFHGEEKGSCAAYPNGIPTKFTMINSGHSGKGKFPRHEKVEDDQVGDFILEVDDE